MRKSILVAFVATLSTLGFVQQAAALQPGGNACISNTHKVYQIKAAEAQQAATPLGRAIKASVAIKWRNDTYKRCVAAYS
jgi:hypothetical protein